MALKNRNNNGEPLIHHSDKGLQYWFNDYQALLTEKYDPYENAITERINGTLKQEFDTARNIKNLHIKKEVIKNAIEIYNNFRPHLSNHILTPQEMHKQNKLQRKQYKSKKLNDAGIVKL